MSKLGPFDKKGNSFYKKLPLFTKNSISPTYKKTQFWILAFIKNSIFGINGDPWSINPLFAYLMIQCIQDRVELCNRLSANPLTFSQSKIIPEPLIDHLKSEISFVTDFQFQSVWQRTLLNKSGPIGYNFKVLCFIPCWVIFF